MSPTSGDLEVVYVDNESRLGRAVEAIRLAPAVGFDTEFVGETTYRPRLCLIQVATAEEILLIDPLAGLDLSGFWSALTGEGVEVVALAARQELLFCLRYAGRLPASVFDPQVAAGLLGFGYPLSHTNLVERVLNQRIEGSEAYTDWRQRPLAARQLEYAASDVRHLLKLRSTLLDRAEAMGRVDWLRSEFARLAEGAVQSEHEERWSRVAGASSLSRRNLAVLRELWRWRDRAAQELDLPPRRVLADDLMLAIAKRSPRTMEDLFALRGMDRSGLRKSAAAIFAAIQEGLRLPEEALPASMRRDDPPQVSLLAQLASILANSLAAEYQVDPALLATTGDLQEFVRAELGLVDSSGLQVLSGWRGEILGQPLAELLAGKRSVRVADLRSASPLRIEPV